jgi:hypothetical protein
MAPPTRHGTVYEDQPMTATAPADTAPDATRIEKDSMGEMTVPADVLYGASTQRAVLNFPVSGRPVHEDIIKAFAHLKSACAEANRRLGRLDDARTDAIDAACREIDQGACPSTADWRATSPSMSSRPAAARART